MGNYQDYIRNNDGMEEDLHDNWVWEQERIDKNRKKLLLSFVDSEKQYNTNPLFRNVCELLIREVDPYKVIQLLINYCSEKDALIKEHLSLQGFPKMKQQD